MFASVVDPPHRSMIAPGRSFGAVCIEALEPRHLMNATPIDDASAVPFSPHVVDPAPGNLLYEKTLADINGDGKLDAVIGFFGNGIKWYAFPRSGRATDPWHRATIRATGDAYEAMKSLDVNHDGAVDIIASVSNKIIWFENPRGHGADPAGGPWVQHVIGDGAAHEFALADLDGDGKTDLATNLTIFFQNSPDNWTAVGAPVYTRVSKGLALFDSGAGHGAIDLLGTNPLPPYRLVWFQNPRQRGGNARTDSWLRYTIGPSYNMQIADFGVSFASMDVNGDGRQDVITAQGEHGGADRGPPGGMHWWEAPVDRAHGKWIGHTIDRTIGDVHQISLADMNNDGRPEIVFSEAEQSATDRVAVLFNVHGQGRTWRIEVLSNESGQNQTVGDIDGDGDMDILNAPHGFLGHETPIELYISRLKKKSTH